VSGAVNPRFEEDALCVLQRALRSAEAVIEDACDELRCDDSPPFAPIGTDDVERLYLLLAGVLVEIHEALRCAEGGVR
jgi:hypothetical protein